MLSSIGYLQRNLLLFVTYVNQYHARISSRFSVVSNFGDYITYNYVIYIIRKVLLLCSRYFYSVKIDTEMVEKSQVKQ